MTGKYLFNSNESIEIYFLDNELKVKWRGNDNISPLKVNDSTFYVQEMNEKIVFVLKPKTHIVLAEKREHKGKKYLFEKLPDGQKTPLEYLLNNEYKNALAGYLAIQQKDSLDKTISQRTLITYGFEAMNEKKMDLAINIFKINTVLYPTQSNGFNRLGSAYWRVKDTSNTVKAYKKALSINPENSEASRFLKKHKFE
ncbi:hypothetical protein GCM10011416_21580 [Polaribacter pacificus]|uniref:Tetratricopeptide repeat-containing protein n=1 Tax=Polaribacter pacificus TaxID=1775173 RepID=A0A917MF33_9FLAO|nr:hypothetical protein GCM10011416_21580 [Polaribacter pacificus]